VEVCAGLVTNGKLENGIVIYTVCHYVWQMYIFVIKLRKIQNALLKIPF
jgi:hypothetical protein